MNELSQDARSLIEAERAQAGATPADRERLRGKLARELGTAAFAAGALAASASHAGEPLGQAAGTAKVASVSLTLTTKLAGAALCAAALAGSALLWRAQVAPREQPKLAPVVVVAEPAPIVQPAPVVVQPALEQPSRAAETPAPRSVRRARPVPALAQEAPDDALARELALLTRAQRALHEGRHQEALALADEHTRSFARGAMRSEALGIAALAHCALGHHDAPAVGAFLASAPTSPLAARVREAWRSEVMGQLTRSMLAALLTLGCVSELEVGTSKPPPEVNDHGAPDAGPPDAGRACVPSDCEPVLDVPVIDCDAGGVVQFLCVRDETGQCTLVPGECSTPIPSGPCEELECDGPLFAGPAREAACSDGSAPLCERDEVSGICSYQCPAQAACGTADGQGCGDEQYCLLRVGMCGTGESGGLCATRPGACDPISAPVCGCDGQSYDSECEAARSGVNVVFAGPCSDVPELCDRCESPPGVPVTPCGDGEHVSGPSACASRTGAAPTSGSRARVPAPATSSTDRSRVAASATASARRTNAARAR